MKLADGKERTIQHMMATTFWDPDGKPISAAQFIQRLYGDLPELFKDEDQLRDLWSRPDTRKGLLEGLEERGYSAVQLADVARMIEAENSDLYDVLAYIAFERAPVSRVERVETRRSEIFEGYDYKQRDFLSFVLDHYIDRGVGQLDLEKLPDLIDLKYHSISAAIVEIGDVSGIRQMFVEFQRRLY